jgi:exodeoxyribonuclease VII large subunit
MHTRVEGEIASLTYHSSGHVYFSLKDAQSTIKAVMWRSSVSRLKFQLTQGMRIIVEGSVGVYTPRGEYQFYAVHIEPYGQGALALAYEQLKEKLQAKGYFDRKNKKSLPQYIQKIALVTAKNSAGLADMLQIIQKRWALLEVYIIDTLVQGEQAPKEIAHALAYADSLGVDVIIVGRGGGSSEDLWAFNSEIVADALFALSTPVISAVGHEVDTLISDFVADIRAPTPSASIEIVLPDSQEVYYSLDQQQLQFQRILEQKIYQARKDVKICEERLLAQSPQKYLKNLQKEFIKLKEDYQKVLNYQLEQFQREFPLLKEQYKQNMQFILVQKKYTLTNLKEKLQQNNPKLACKYGWAKISQEGQVFPLEDLCVNEVFTLEDETRKVKALILSKE